jgi:hypothetical protein
VSCYHPYVWRAPTYRNHQVLCEFVINLPADHGRYIPGPNLIPNLKGFVREESLKQLVLQHRACGAQVSCGTHSVGVHLKDDNTERPHIGRARKGHRMVGDE